MKKYLYLLIPVIVSIGIMILVTHTKMSDPLLGAVCWICAFLVAIPIYIAVKFLEEDLSKKNKFTSKTELNENHRSKK